MLVREAAQNNTDLLLPSWLGIVLFYFVSARTSPGSGSPPRGPWRSQGKGFPGCFHLCLWSYTVCIQTMLLLGASASEAQKSISLINSHGITPGCPWTSSALPCSCQRTTEEQPTSGHLTLASSSAEPETAWIGHKQPEDTLAPLRPLAFRKGHADVPLPRLQHAAEAGRGDCNPKNLGLPQLCSPWILGSRWPN